MQARDEISQALRGVATPSNETEPMGLHPAQQEFMDSVGTAVDDLSVPGFGTLDPQIIGQTLQLVAALALDVERPEIDPTIADLLEGSIGRWARRKLRKCLDGTDQDEIQNIRWDDWQQSLRGAGAAVALDRNQGDLRCALLALSAESDDSGAEELTESENIADRVRSREIAFSLLRQVTRIWCTQIGQ